ncbi:hypothetical protein [Flagellimonas meishanensis]|uniref:hypothetical protein n=1 Tax=Flagellimonas meishanensis TaxID=2873264 RepID=UPI001CA6C98F|nr:hypothetical protein [[Muricauda] meishanensis]
MDLFFYGIGAGIVAFLALLRVHKILFKLFEINPLLDLGVGYILYHVFADKLYSAVPQAWQIKQFENPLQIDGSIGFILHLDKPQLSAFDLTTATLGLCIIGHFVYVFTFKKFFGEKEDVQEHEQEE